MRLDQRKFRAWLSAKQPDDIVGHRCDCLTCPIARFYKDGSGGAEVSISESGNGYCINRGDGERLLPRWAAQFVYLVDGEKCTGITARRALELLSET